MYTHLYIAQSLKPGKTSTTRSTSCTAEPPPAAISWAASPPYLSSRTLPTYTMSLETVGAHLYPAHGERLARCFVYIRGNYRAMFWSRAALHD